MKYSVLAIMLAVAGCAHQSPQTLMQQPHVAKVAPIVKPAAPVIAATPNAIVKKRWYSHFPHHPKFFH